MIIIFKDNKIGSGDLGEKLFVGALESILKNIQNGDYDKNDKLSKIIFINSGVLACVSENEKIISTLSELEKCGIEVICCKTCLDYFKINQLQVGKEGNSLAIMQDMLTIPKVVVF